MLTHFKIENFKAWREADLTLGKVTGFFGSNSAGKSSLLQFLLALKQTRNATDQGLLLDFGGPTAMVNLGTFKDVVHQQDEQTSIRWVLDWTLPRELVIRARTPSKRRDQRFKRRGQRFKGKHLQTRCEVVGSNSLLRRHELVYRFDEVDFKLQSKDGSEKDFELWADTEKFEFIRTPGRAPRSSRPIKAYRFPNEMWDYYQNADFLGDFELCYEKLMDSIYYLGPLREYPWREYHWGGSRPEDVGPRGERTMDAILAATRDGKMRSLGYRKKKRTFQEMIAYWLKKLGLIDDFSLEEIAAGTNLYQAKVKTSRSSMPTALTDVGFGVSQILPILVLLYYVPKGSTVLLEQPEIHLHPRVQSELADVMLNIADVRNVQIILESHSEHLMRRLQRRVAEEEASSDDVKLYFVSSQRGQAQVEDLRLNDWGEIENWPDQFFGDEMGEIFAITEASLRRRTEQSK